MSKPVTPFGKYHQHHQDMSAEMLFVCLFCRNFNWLGSNFRNVFGEITAAASRNITSQGAATVPYEASILCS